MEKWIRLFNAWERRYSSNSRTAGFLPEQLEYLNETFDNMDDYHLVPMIMMDLACVFDANGDRRPTRITIPELIQEDPKYWATFNR